MEEYLMTIMERAGVFMVLAQAVIHFRPNPSYEKYFRFLAGIMTVVILIMPVLELTNGQIREQYETSLMQYRRKLEQAQAQGLELPGELTASAAYLNSMEEEIKSKLNNETAEGGMDGYVVKEVEIEESKVAEGTPHLKLILMAEKQKEAAAQEICIEQIGLSGDRKETENSEAGRLRQEAARLLGIETKQVEVEILE